MREPIRDRERLEHIVEAIDRILVFADSKTREDLETDNLKYYGIVKNIEHQNWATEIFLQPLQATDGLGLSASRRADD